MVVQWFKPRTLARLSSSLAMTDPTISQPRALAPRRLEHKETLQSLNHWRSVFRNYYRRCQYYGRFLSPDATWDNSENCGFTEPEATGLKRSIRDLAADLRGFLDCVGSYLPFDYVGDKLRAQSTNIQSVWTVIYEIYDAEITTTNFLDYACMSKDPEETYRSYYNRLVGFVRQHLPSSYVESEGVIAPADGENLTVALLDAIAIHWLISIDKRLISIVKTEFATALKTKRLSQMVKEISQSIDDLLIRNDNRDQIALIKSDFDQSTPCDSSDLKSLVNRIERLENKPVNKQKKKFTANSGQFRRPQCSHCIFLNKQLGASLQTDHATAACGKRSISVNLIQTLDNVNISEEFPDSSHSESPEGEYRTQNILSNPSLQTSEQQGSKANTEQAAVETLKPPIDVVICPSSNINSSKTAAVSELNNLQVNQSVDIDENQQLSSSISTCRGNNTFKYSADHAILAATLASLHSSSFKWNKLDKSTSPRIKCRLNKVTFSALIDTGAEINVLDKDFAISINLGISSSNESALAANKLPLKVFGQTTLPVSVECITESGTIMLHLGIMLVIANLGTPCLLGEPAKSRNNIVCLPRQRMVLIGNGSDVSCVPYESNSPKYSLLRAISQTKLNPGDQLIYPLPEHLKMESHVAVSPRQNSMLWLLPSIQEPRDGNICLTNLSNDTIIVKKADHLADVRDSQLVDLPPKPFPGKALHADTFQFSDFAMSRDTSPDYLKQIKVDPDNVLSVEDRQIFHDLHQRFASLFTPQPGKYNGKYGYIDNKLQFSAPPPPNTRTHIPNYSPAMNTILAEKMDLLESWGVLAEPELMGVSVEFISPSMLVPKPEGGEYRLVTDFSALNVYLKKIPNTSATMAQAKARIARSEYVIHLDLANYFYQNGLQLEDTKYLGTIHPFKGLRIYTCDPQGLKGASERSYEKLVRIFGDMVQHGRLAQMADGLHVLGNSVAELAANYVEVLNRAELCNLTFKPAKVIVCPQTIKLFGWELRGQVWHPTAHTTSALVNAPKPSTVKQLRSFLGSFKQLSSSLPNYAVTVHSLEQVVAGKASAERLQWTDDLNLAFENAIKTCCSSQGRR